MRNWNSKFWYKYRVVFLSAIPPTKDNIGIQNIHNQNVSNSEYAISELAA